MELNAFDKFVHVIVLLVKGVPLVFVSTVATFPFVGHADTPVNWFKYKTLFTVRD